MRHVFPGLGLAIAMAACAPASAADKKGNAEDLAKINALHARYLFAYDWQDFDSYVGTFAQDGVLDFGQGELKGRAAIIGYLTERRKKREQERVATTAGERPRVGRHIISNVVVQFDGRKARSVAYWTHMSSGPTGYGTVDFFGHYEDELVKVGDEWLYTRRRVYNQAVPEWSASANNPVLSPSPPPKERPSNPADVTTGRN